VLTSKKNFVIILYCRIIFHIVESEMARVSLYRVQVLDRALSILEVLGREGPELTLAELSERLRLPKSTAHRLLGVLEQHRFVERGQRGGRYRLGLRLFELGSKVIASLDLRERARRHLERLMLETGETSHLCVLDDGGVLYLDKVEASRTVRVPSIVGQRYPVHCGAAGKTLLAFLQDDELDNLIKARGLKAYTSNTITTPARLKSELQLIRERGYAVDNEEFEEGLRCIGAPVRDHSNKVVAAISIAGPTFRITADKIPALARSVVAVAKELSAELGYQELQPARETDKVQVVI
jgi:IclR family KDG regulon transcriptional repressor